MFQATKQIEIDDYDDELEVQLHDGSWIVLKKVDSDYDPTDRVMAYRTLENARREQKMLTGLFYVDEGQPDLLERLNLVDEPLSSLAQSRLRPGREALAEVIAAL